MLSLHVEITRNLWQENISYFKTSWQDQKVPVEMTTTSRMITEWMAQYNKILLLSKNQCQ